MKRNAFVFFNTWRCFLNCSYCDYKTKDYADDGSYTLECFGNSFRIDEEYHWAYWLALLNRFRPYHLDFCGGEPLIYDGLLEMIDHFPRGCTWAMTSNTLASEVIKRISPIGSVAWTASDHFTREDMFINNLWILRRKGFSVRVTMVFTPENYKAVLDKMKRYQEMKIGINLHPLFKQGFSWYDHNNVYDEVKQKAVEMNNNNSINFIGAINKRFKGEGRHPACPGGANFFSLSPDGKVYRCVSSYVVLNKEPIGHIKDVEPSKLAQPCEGGCVFTCDFDCRGGRWEGEVNV